MYKNWMGVTIVGLLLAVGTANAGIIAYWPFDEGAGTTAQDVVGGFDATLTGIDWVAGPKGGFAAQSGGGSDRIAVGTGPTPTTKDLSIAWWMIDNNASWHSMMCKGTDSSPAGYYILLRPADEDSPLLFRIGGFEAYGDWGAECCLPKGAYKDGEWVHILCTYDSASDTATIYLNGKLAPNGALNPKVGGIAGANGYCKGVNDATQPLYIVGPTETFNGTVDEVAIWDNALSAEQAGKVFQLGPLALDPRMAGRPSPADAASDIPRETTLTWSAGEGATTHDVYLGTVANDVNNATQSNPQGLLVGKGQSDLLFDPPGRLAFGTTYYWRVDEIASGQVPFHGTVWSFTTEPKAYPVDGKTIKVTASSADTDQGPENTVNGSGLTNDLHTNELTQMWLSAATATGPAWIQYEFDRVLRLNSLWVWNHNGLLESMLGLGAKDVTIAYSVDGVTFTTLGTQQFARATGKIGYACNTTVDLQNIAAKYVKLTVNSNWGGILQQYGLSEVRFFSVPVQARQASPEPGATAVTVQTDLSWRAGREAAQHQVFLGTDPNVLSPAATVQTPSYTPALNLDTTYYWKVVEVNNAETPSTFAGDVWSFKTEAYAAVDDFESYTNDMDAGMAIFQTWADGFGTTTNGSVVGNDPSPFAERTIVNSGKQSMPMWYDNTSATNSEAMRTFTGPQDWSKHNIKGLTLRFYGDPTNAAQQMYVKINNTRIPYDGEASNLTLPLWQMWYIDLAGVNVSSVTKLSIGFDRLNGSGGKGKVFIDDIRLYPLARQLVTPKDPGTTGLQTQFQFEGNASDLSGKGHNGTPQGGPVYAAGKTGQALSLDGVDDCIDVGSPATLSFEKDFTWSAWIKTASDGTVLCRAPATGNWAQGGKTLFVINGILRMDVGWVGALSSVRTVNDDQWHHVAMTTVFQTSGNNDTTTLYIDGRVAATRSNWNVNAYPEGALSVKIGFTNSNFPSPSSWFRGLIDDVRIYDRALSDSELASLAGRTVPFDRSF